MKKALLVTAISSVLAFSFNVNANEKSETQMKIEQAMKLDRLIGGIVPTQGTDDRDISGIACDSRQARKGSLFVAIPGYRKDGADYIEDAVRRVRS